MDDQEAPHNNLIQPSPPLNTDVTNSNMISQVETSNLPDEGKHRFPSKLMIGLLFLIIIIISFGIYLYLKSSNRSSDDAVISQGQQPTATTTNPTTGWATFSNSKFGFSFKYPNSQIQLCSTDQNSEETAVFYETVINCDLNADSQNLLTVFIYDPTKFSIETIGEPISTNKKLVSGKEFTIDEHMPGYAKEEDVIIIARTTLSEDTILELNFLLNKTLDRADVDQILSTFRFTEEKEEVNAVEIYRKEQLTEWEGNILKDTYWPKLKLFKSGDASREVYLVDCEVTQEGLDATGVPTLVPNVSNIAETTLKKLLENHYGGFPDKEEIASYEKAIGRSFKNNDSGINGVRLENGVLTINFYDSVAAYGGGSSRVGCMSTVIGLTAKQFPTIKDIKMCIDKYDNCEMDFQP